MRGREQLDVGADLTVLTNRDWRDIQSCEIEVDEGPCPYGEVEPVVHLEGRTDDGPLPQLPEKFLQGAARPWICGVLHHQPVICMGEQGRTGCALGEYGLSGGIWISIQHALPLAAAICVSAVLLSVRAIFTHIGDRSTHYTQHDAD